MYDNIDVESAKNALRQCLETLNYEYSTELLSTLNSAADWNADSKATFKNAIDKLVNERYEELKNEINACIEKLDKVNQYKELQTQNENYNYEISQKKYQLNTARSMQYKENTPEAAENKGKIERLKNDISNLENQKESNESRMRDLRNSINN